MKLYQYLKPISISLSPNTERDDVFLALKLLFQPWEWKEKNQKSKIKILEKEFKKYFDIKHAFSFNSGRSALMAILDSLGLNSDDEILLQAFTCNAVVNPILWSNLKPIFVDCDEKTFNIDNEDLKKKITSQSKVVIVQHTFGLPADMDEILDICQKNNLILIEDCAHSLGAEYKGKKVGLFGKVAFFSFSRDKIISSVYGGMAITNDDELAEKIKKFQEKINKPSYFWIFQQLLHPILMNLLILPTYGFLGKYLLVLFQRFYILSKAVHWKEKRGQKPDYFPRKMPEALAELALNQFKKLERFNEHRQKIANYYFKALEDSKFELPLRFETKKHVWLRFVIKHPRAHHIIKNAWRKNILIGDWYALPVAPNNTKLEKMGYKAGDCSNAEKLAKTTLNLPTHINISEKDAHEIVNFIATF
ncbi:MAG: aminotransferase class I/II-fold pyridoxal phosphate-dependent enzyme [Patescibacteria group bacterium]